jgi:hypothetical protein
VSSASPQKTRQVLVFSQRSSQLPRHRTSQVVTLRQSMTATSAVSSVVVTPQRLASWHEYFEPGPTMAPHETTL